MTIKILMIILIIIYAIMAGYYSYKNDNIKEIKYSIYFFGMMILLKLDYIVYEIINDLNIIIKMK